MLVLALATLFAAAQACAQQQNTGEGMQQHASTEVIGAKQVVQGPTYEDVYCAGYLTTQPPQVLGHLVAGWNYPHTQTYGTHDYLYLQAKNLEPGKTYEIVREVKDPNHMRLYKGQLYALERAGRLYFEMGSVKVKEQRGDIAITEVNFACDGMMPGDLVVPMPERTIPPYHGKMEWDRFAPPNGKTTGRILLARDYEVLIGDRSKVYLDIGANRGLKVGDWFRVTRDYAADREDPADMISFGPRDMVSDEQQHPQRLKMQDLHKLPRRSLGELVITDVTPKSATGVVTFALEEMFIGDGVEMMDVPPPTPPEAPPAPMGPSIACNAVPASVRQGDTSTITCNGQSPDNRPLTYAFAPDRGAVSPRDNVAVLATNGVGPGPITVNATVTDDRNLSASTAVTVNVEAPPAPPAPTLGGEVAFKTNSAYVDNRAKAMLDGIALRMNQDKDMKAAVIGFADPKEPSKTLAARRATAVKAYLVKKGIDPARIETRTSTSGSGKKAEVWLIPAGASMP
jgi:outer membrane protein OmpA-like peptidoglycan-associated protein